MHRCGTVSYTYKFTELFAASLPIAQRQRRKGHGAMYAGQTGTGGPCGQG